MTNLLCQETGKPVHFFLSLGGVDNSAKRSNVCRQKQFAEFEVKGAAMFFDHHLSLTIPEEREEDDEKVMLTRYTPLGVVGVSLNDPKAF